MIVASESAKFGQPEITIGVTPAPEARSGWHGCSENICHDMVIITTRTLTAARRIKFGLATALSRWNDVSTRR